MVVKGQLEEIKLELEENRRKLINLKMQKDAACEVHVTSPAIANGSLSPEKPVDKMKLRELKDSIDEIKVNTSLIEWFMFSFCFFFPTSKLSMFFE